MGKKLYPGPKLRRYREQLGMAQNDFAETLGISASYLNQIENNQRPLTASVLLKLTDSFDVDLQTFSDAEDDRLAAELREATGDPLFQGTPLDLRELKDVVSVSPSMVKAFLTLYRAYQESDTSYRNLAEQLREGEAISALSGAQFPYEEVRDYFYIRNNHIEELDQAAEQLHAGEGFRIGNAEKDLTRFLRENHGINCVLTDEPVVSGEVRRFDPKSSTLYLCETQASARRAFQLAHQIALVRFGGEIKDLIRHAAFASRETESVCRIGLANYFAGALIMPYNLFLAEAKRCKYDVEKLELRFGSTFEAVCHRLSTLQRPGAKGVPFYFVRVDMAGNISKRQSATVFNFARSGGACPLWNVHEAFSSPGRILTQIARMPDGQTYFCLARTVTKRGGGYLEPLRKFAVGLGCQVQYAKELVYSAGVDLENDDAVVPIGPGCRVCERQYCPQRAFPPVGRRLDIDENRRGFRPYSFT